MEQVAHALAGEPMIAERLDEQARALHPVQNTCVRGQCGESSGSLMS